MWGEGRLALSPILSWSRVAATPPAGWLLHGQQGFPSFSRAVLGLPPSGGFVLRSLRSAIEARRVD